MDIYLENIKKYKAKTAHLKKTLYQISLLRLFIFIASISILIFLFSTHRITAVFIALPFIILSFGIVIHRHYKVAYKLKHATFLKEINESEILRIKGQLDSFETGKKFINHEHPYTSDLDIFGTHSIFQLINRTTTESGMICLANWLSAAASDSEIKERQKAIQELSEQLDWRQNFQATGMHYYNNKSDYNKLLEWVNQPTILLKNSITYNIIGVSLPIIFIISTYLLTQNLGNQNGLIFLALMLIVLVINYLILKKVSPQAEEIVKTSTQNLNTLKGYSELIQNIENEDFKSKKLIDLQSQFKNHQYSASKEIKKISESLEYAHHRPQKKIPLGGNPAYLTLNYFLLLDVFLIIKTERWKVKNKAHLASWAEAISEFEVINSFAGFSFSNPSYAFPEITKKLNYICFEDLGHPLIHSDKRVYNDFLSEDNGHIVMITGSNMGGKSTFLRTVGLNLVLALAGAPCCARTGQISNLKVFTSMRTQDNLSKGISSFYAELNRIEEMLELINNHPNVYFLLDEMFKGTNSEDRHKGGYSLILQLKQLNTSGMIATHDIELAKLVGNKKLVTNYSFNSEIKNDTMIFSYKLHPAICNDFNASELMKRSGIQIISD